MQQLFDVEWAVININSKTLVGGTCYVKHLVICTERLNKIMRSFGYNSQKWSQDLNQAPPNMGLECCHYINLLGAIHGVDEKTELFSLYYAMELCSSGPQCKWKPTANMYKMLVELITFLPFSTFCAAIGLKSKFISFWSFSFFSFSSFFKSSVFLTFPPLLTWCWTCWMNRCCFAPFLFFKPNVLSCRNKYVWIKYMDVENQDTDMSFMMLPCT